MIPFLSRLNKTQIEKAVRAQDDISALLKIAMDPPGWFDRAFGNVSGTGNEMDRARNRLNKTTHGDNE